MLCSAQIWAAASQIPMWKAHGTVTQAATTPQAAGQPGLCLACLRGAGCAALDAHTALHLAALPPPPAAAGGGQAA